MNISYNWLKDFVDVDLPPGRLAEVITSRTATVDAVETLRDDLRQFVVARVVECAPHPDSDHLSVTKVDAGTGELLDVVCGAPNVRAGKLYPFAKTGTKMPAGFTITYLLSASRTQMASGEASIRSRYFCSLLRKSVSARSRSMATRAR